MFINFSCLFLYNWRTSIFLLFKYFISFLFFKIDCWFFCEDSLFHRVFIITLSVGPSVIPKKSYKDFKGFLVYYHSYLTYILLLCLSFFFFLLLLWQLNICLINHFYLFIRDLCFAIYGCSHPCLTEEHIIITNTFEEP